MEPAMLKDLNVDQARFVAILARTARTQRDLVLGNVAESDLGGVKPQRGVHNPSADLGYEPLPPGASQTAALREAVTSLSEPARRELYTLMRIGQGDLSAKKWHRGLAEAEMLGGDTITAAIVEDADLQDHIAKGLYETDLPP
jgi:hypothetical protein